MQHAHTIWTCPEKKKKKKEKQKNKTYQQNAIYRFNLFAALNFDLEIKVTETNVAQSNSQSIISKDCLTKNKKIADSGMRQL